jgi:hypothetical protein
MTKPTLAKYLQTIRHYSFKRQLMLKLLILCGLFLSSSVVLASPLEQVMTIKDRLRISLWVEGIEETPVAKTMAQSELELPEEIELALKKL